MPALIEISQIVRPVRLLIVEDSSRHFCRHKGTHGGVPVAEQGLLLEAQTSKHHCENSGDFCLQKKWTPNLHISDIQNYHPDQAILVAICSTAGSLAAFIQLK